MDSVVDIVVEVVTVLDTVVDTVVVVIVVVVSSVVVLVSLVASVGPCVPAECPRVPAQLVWVAARVEAAASSSSSATTMAAVLRHRDQGDLDTGISKDTQNLVITSLAWSFRGQM